MVNISLPVSMFQFCPSCGVSLHSVDTLKEHCSQCLAGHPMKFFQCSKQEKGSKGKRFQCNNCGKKFPTKKGFTKHRYFCDPTVLLADHALSEQQHGNSDFCTDLGKTKELDGE